MALTAEQYNFLAAALGQDFNLPRLEQMLQTQANRRLETIINPTGLSQTQIIDYVLKTAEAERWTWDLVRAARDANPNGPNIQAFIARYPFYNPATPPPAPDPYLTTPYLLSRQILIDRQNLRNALQELESDLGPRVLVVNGERASGKTYSSELIYYLAHNANPKHTVIPVDLDTDVQEPDALVQFIADRMGRDSSTIPGPEQEQKMRLALRLANWLTNQIINTGPSSYWFVFDGFRERTVLTETKALIEELAIRAHTTLRQCRVVLINYTEVLPARVRNAAGREQISQIGEQELVEFLKWFNRSNPPKYTEAELKEKVDIILTEVGQGLATVPNGHLLRLELINASVRKTVRELFP
jgi:hypothetical protein